MPQFLILILLAVGVPVVVAHIGSATWKWIGLGAASWSGRQHWSGMWRAAE